MAIPNHLDVVTRARDYFAHLPPGPERAYRIVNRVAWELRADKVGLFHKTGGTRFHDRSLDVLMVDVALEGANGRIPTFDVLRDAEGKAEPAWSRTRPTGFGDRSKWRAADAPPDAPIEPQLGVVLSPTEVTAALTLAATIEAGAIALRRLLGGS